ncbi:unnamed protein product [Camellia sinensis]
MKRIEELARESKMQIDSILQRSHSGNGCCCSKVFILIKDMGHIGRPMVEVFSVRINRIDGEKLYGTITVTDGLSTQFIYNRSRDHYESISPGETALLTGPARSISASDSFTIDVALKDKDKLSPDDDVSSEQIPWNVYDSNKYNEPLYDDVPGKNGSVTVNYVVLRKALEATVEVTLVNRGGENSLPVYGLLTARNGNFMNESVLFRKKSDEHVDVRPEQPIPLSRSVVAVPSNSSLIVWAGLMDHNGEIAKGTAEFPAQLSGTAQKNIFGQDGEIRVKVTWSLWVVLRCVGGCSVWNYWRTHMRKKAQERKKAMSPPSNSSSSVSNNPPVDLMPFMETKERSFYDTGGDHDQMLTPKGINKGFEEGECTETGYSMNDIWEDIALSESDTMKTVCETIMASPIWNYCPPPPDMLWMMEDLAHGSDLAQGDLRRSDKGHRDCIVVSEQEQDLHPHQCKWIQCLLVNLSSH